MTPKTSYLRTRRSLVVLRSVFGERDAVVITLVVIALLSISWMGDFIYNWFNGYQLILAVTFPIVLAFLLWRARKIAASMTIKVEQKPPKKSPVLILFLSPPGKDKSKLGNTEEYATFLQNAGGRIIERDKREWFEGAWRMPLEAIAYHLGRLEKIVVLYSADAPDKPDGTYRDYGTFKELLEQLLGEKKDTISIIGLSDIDQQWQTGVDFENADDLANGALRQVFSWLHAQNIQDDEIIIDIQKIPAVAGAVFSLGEGRKLQYVSTRSYQLWSI